MCESTSSLNAKLSAGGILRFPELVQLLDATVEAYQHDVPGVRSVMLFGGIPLGEFHPHFSDVDLAVVFDGEPPQPRMGLPETVRNAVKHIPLFADTHLQPKHVGSNTLAAIQRRDWRTWAAETAGALVTETPYPFTLCDTWLLHNHGLTMWGPDLRDNFHLKGAPPKHTRIKLAQEK